ncbi:MAG: hypothetical protein J6U08_10400 [Paludibacteraceae bacterium]|nr:hypothetical protein [Paludibacteraceae bacterium]
MMINKYSIHKTVLVAILILCFSSHTRAGDEFDKFDFNIIRSAFKFELKKDLKDYKLKGPVKTAEDSITKLVFNSKGQLIRHQTEGLFEELIYDDKGNLLNEFLFVFGQYFESDITKEYAPQSEYLKVIKEEQGKNASKYDKVTPSRSTASTDKKTKHWNITQLVSYKYTATQKIKELTVRPEDLMSGKLYKFIYEYDDNDSLIQYTLLENNKFLNAKIYTYKGNLLVADTFINVLKEKGGITKYKYGNNKKLKRVTSKYKGVFGFEEDTIYYDQNGRKIKEKDNNYKYNEKGELIEYSTMFGDHKLTEKYTYTDQGKETIYLTDDTIKNKRKFVNKDDELVYQYYYNPRNGELELSITQTFDSQGNVIENKYERKGKEPEITTYEYTYDLYGNITSKKVNGKIEGRFRYTYYQPVKKSK